MTSAAFALVALAFLAGAAGQFLVFANHDVAWYAYATEYRAAGCTLYVDCFFDPNPPYVFWFHWLGTGLGRLAGLAAIDGTRLLVLALTLACAALAWRVARRELAVSPLLALATTFAPITFLNLGHFSEFAQRDGLSAAMLLPYVLLAAARHQTGRVPWTAGALGGVLAGLAIAMKPHAVVIPLLLELAMFRSKGSILLRRPDLGALVATFLLCSVALALFAPGYVDFMLRFRTFYPYLGGGIDAFLQQAARDLPASAVPALLVLPFLQRDLPYPSLRKALLLASLGGALHFLAQMRGLAYHLLPAELFVVSLALATAVILNGQRRLSVRATLLLALAAVPLALGLLQGTRDAYGRMQSYAAARERPATSPLAQCLATEASVQASPSAPVPLNAARVIALLRQEGGALFLSTDIPPLFPAADYAGVPHRGRLPHLWLLPGLVEGKAAIPPDQYEQGKAFLFDVLAEDLQRLEPRFLIVHDGLQTGIHDPEFALLRFLGQDSRLARLLATYVPCNPPPLLRYAVHIRMPG